MKIKNKQRKMEIYGEKHIDSEIKKFRDEYLKKKIDLVDVTKLCEFKLGYSGWCNDFNEPNEEIYHIQVFYRDECIGSLYPSKEQPNWDEKYVVFIFDDEDFIIFRKVKLEKENK